MTSTENRVAFAQEQNFSQNQDSSDSDNDYPVKAQEIIEPKVVQVKDVPEDDEDDYYVEKYTEEEEEEEVKKGGIKNFLKTQLDKFFVEHIPVESLKELSPAYMYYFGVVAYACAIAFFCYFTYNSYLNATTNAFIAIDKNSGVCNTVPIVITQNFAADNEGNWEGSPAYVYSNGKYDLFLNNFQVGSLGEYQQMMNVFYDSLQNAGKLAKRQNLPYNLILWMSYIRYYSLDDPHQTNFSSIGYGQLQYIQLTGDPSEVFDSRYYQARVGSAAGYCSEYSMTTFDQANTLIETRLNYTSFVANPVCFAAVIPENFGYLSVTDNDVFSMRLEVRAFTTAIAVNFGFIEIDDLGKGDSVDRIFEFRNVTYRLAEYYDTRYPQQDTIQCVQNVSEILEDQTGIESACFYNMGNSLTLPVFHHIGTSYETPSYCDCDTTGKTTQCNEFNLLEALIYYPIEEDSSNPANSANVFARQLQKLMALLVRYPEYPVLNRKAYNATWGAAAPAYQDQAASTKTEAWLENAYNFCLDRNSGDMCSLAVFNSVGLSDHKVSEYKYQLTNGSCVDSVTIDETYWDKLLNNPPTVLTQSYFECYQEPYSAFLDAVGIASGNTSLAVPMTVVFLLPLLYLVLVALRQVPPKEEYKTVEKEEAIEILSILLLRVRDGKTRGLKHNGVLVKLVDELISAAKEEGGYPDSDDDGSDDEELPRKSVSKKRISKRTSSGTTNGQVFGLFCSLKILF